MSPLSEQKFKDNSTAYTLNYVEKERAHFSTLIYKHMQTYPTKLLTNVLTDFGWNRLSDKERFSFKKKLTVFFKKA